MEHADEMITARLDVGTDIHLSTYVRRHIVFKGSITVGYPGTDQPSDQKNLGDMFPVREFYPLVDSTFSLTAGEDNSIYYCIIPGYGNDTLNCIETVLSVGEVYTIKKCRVAFVYGKNYTVNNQARTDNSVLACETDNVTVVATETLKLVEFVVSSQTSLG